MHGDEVNIAMAGTPRGKTIAMLCYQTNWRDTSMSYNIFSTCTSSWGLPTTVWPIEDLSRLHLRPHDFHCYLDYYWCLHVWTLSKYFLQNLIITKFLRALPLWAKKEKLVLSKIYFSDVLKVNSTFVNKG